VRKILPKKRPIDLDVEVKEEAAEVADKDGLPEAKKRKEELETESDKEARGKNSADQEEKDMSDEMDESSEDRLKSSTDLPSSEANTMTLRQFTDIVLASEGLANASQQKKAPVDNRRPIVLHAKVKEENNNRSTSESATASEVVASLVKNNNDLIVEVKNGPPSSEKAPSAQSKLVVLSPRQPPGSHLLPHYQQRKVAPFNANSVVVSVKPRVNAEPRPAPLQARTGEQRRKFVPAPSTKLEGNRVPPLLGRAPNVPRLVEEWLNKIPAAAGADAEVKDAGALNLSTKRVSAPPPHHANVSKTTQVYLRPIPTPPKLSPATVIVGGTSPKARSANGGMTAPRPVRLHQYSPDSSHYSSNSPTSPGRIPMEISRVEAVPNGSTSPSPAHAESVRARALRDVQVAHVKDIHGN